MHAPHPSITIPPPTNTSCLFSPTHLPGRLRRGSPREPKSCLSKHPRLYYAISTTLNLLRLFLRTTGLPLCPWPFLNRSSVPPQACFCAGRRKGGWREYSGTGWGRRGSEGHREKGLTPAESRGHTLANLPHVWLLPQTYVRAARTSPPSPAHQLQGDRNEVV